MTKTKTNVVDDLMEKLTTALETEDAELGHFSQLRKEVHTYIELRRELERILDNFSTISRKLSSESKAETRRGAALWLLGKVEDAIKVLEACRVTKERSFFLGISYLDIGKISLAHDLLKEAYLSDSSDFQILSHYCEAKIKLRNFEEAKGLLERMGKKYQGEPDFHYLEGLFEDMQNNVDKACVAYEQALELDNAHSKSLFRLAYNLDIAGEDKKAMEHYKQLREIRPINVNTMINLGVFYEDNNEYEKAVDCYNAILDYYPDHLRARLYLTDAQASLDMYYDEELARRRDRLEGAMKLPISDLDFPNRVKASLSRVGATTLGELVKKTEQELLELPSMGPAALKEINEVLRLKGLSLATRKEDENAVAEDAFTKPITDFEWQSRVKDIFDKMKIQTIGDLLKYTEKDLLKNRNLGLTSIKATREVLASMNLALKKE